MNNDAILFFLCLCIALLFGIILYQRFAFRTRAQKELREIGQNLKRILDTDSQEAILIFTDNPELMELAAQMNRLLERHRKIQADFRRSEIASKKMLSNISHDIKTPMTVILGYLEIMRLHGQASAEMLFKTEQKANDVMELINQFFTLAKLESGDMELPLSRIDLGERCRESILDFYEILTSSGFQVEIALPDQPVFIWGNDDALQRIFGNLISNAVRYGADGKFLKISLETKGTSVLVHVTDHGKGIDPAFFDQVFDRLFTLEDSRSRNIQGNGLGLSIAKNLAVQMGGTLTLESVPGQETTFTVSFPKHPS